MILSITKLKPTESTNYLVCKQGHLLLTTGKTELHIATYRHLHSEQPKECAQ